MAGIPDVCSCSLMATFTPGFWLAGRAGGGKAVLRSIFLDVTKMCFEMFAGTIMCYGQTGAGKTYTMTGQRELQAPGILLRALQQVREWASGQDGTQKLPIPGRSWSQWDPGLQGAAACRETGYAWWVSEVVSE